jgi:endogenous inhibitor of DNA gyrase (YacG/DUF329 family)
MTTSTCVNCGCPIAVTTRNPNRRFCSPRCRVADWHAHQRSNDVANGDNNVHPRTGVPNAVRAANGVPNAVPAANGVTKCPHCRHDLAVIAVVIPADAAHVPIPEVIT